MINPLPLTSSIGPTSLAETLVGRKEVKPLQLSELISAELLRSVRLVKESEVTIDRASSVIGRTIEDRMRQRERWATMKAKERARSDMIREEAKRISRDFLLSKVRQLKAKAANLREASDDLFARWPDGLEASLTLSNDKLDEIFRLLRDEIRP